MLRPRKASILLAAVGAGLALGAGPAEARDDVPWAACPDAAGFQCAQVPAPLDYDEPRGARISVGVIRHPADDPARRKGVMFWNAGGPGGAPSAALPQFLSFFPEEVRDRFDIVAVDPRGIGRTEQLRCYATPEEEAVARKDLPAAGFPTGAEETRRQVAAQARFNRACAEHGGPIQRHMSTANVARDMDLVRERLGAPELNYWGPSYGTYLGVTYANLFPKRMGNLVLDGNVDPGQWNDRRRGAFADTFTRIASPAGTESGLRLLLRRCGDVSVGRCAFSAGSPGATRDKYRRLRDRLRRAPVRVGEQTFTDALLTSTVAGGMAFQNANEVVPQGWKELAELLQSVWSASEPGARAVEPDRAQARTQRALVRRAGGPSLGADFEPQLPEGTLGVLCGESPNPRVSDYTVQGAFANATQSPLGGFGPLWSWLAQPCGTWQARDADRYTGPFDRSTRPMLLVGTLADPNTAYSGTLRMAQQTRNSRVLTETGGGHTAWLNRSTCADERITRFLVSGALPPVGTVCDQDRAPF